MAVAVVPKAADMIIIVREGDLPGNGSIPRRA
jgi:hypothetical protein